MELPRDEEGETILSEQPNHGAERMVFSWSIQPALPRNKCKSMFPFLADLR
jgi:hypothetical protein